MTKKKPQTVAQKILARKSCKPDVSSGEIVEAEPDAVMSHDNAALVIKQFREIGVERVWNREKIVIVLDHRIPAESVKTANAHKAIREFVREQSLTHFYDMGEGICHQVVLEKGHALPGELVLGTDSHTTSYGAVGAFSTGIGATEMAAVWATGKLWLKVPETIRVVLNGKLRPGVYAKDAILHVIGRMGAEGANYRSIEFTGDATAGFSVSERITMANCAMEMGAKCAFFKADDVVDCYVRSVTKRPTAPVFADPDAEYTQTVDCNIGILEPQLACPHQVDRVQPVSRWLGKPIHQAFLGSCTNGRLDDMEIAAGFLRGKKIHPGVRMIVIPASRSIFRDMVQRGFLDIFLNAGCVVLHPGCGPCLGAHQGLLADGETCLASSNRNFQGRMGSSKAEIFLASPAVVAVSALNGSIQLPDVFKP
ncbi:MAG TPA: 3-isopropylmalate dehydratase large subunit [bacterium]